MVYSTNGSVPNEEFVLNLQTIYVWWPQVESYWKQKNHIFCQLCDQTALKDKRLKVRTMLQHYTAVGGPIFNM
jgi:hypothetical protein